MNSPWNAEHSEGYQTPEQDSLCMLLGNGYVDTYRYIYPTRNDRYTFWTSRWNKRNTNEGWRIDYFLVSEDLRGKILDAQILDLARDSDHCPITLELDIKVDPLRSVKRLSRSNYTYKGLLKIEDRHGSFRQVARLDLTRVWETFDREEAETRLRGMQKALALAVKHGDKDKAWKLQVRIMMSLDARFLAILHVCNTAISIGIDEIEWRTPNEKAKAALALDIWGYGAMPPIVYKMRTRGGRQRNVGVLSHHDRAIDKIASFALNPVAATTRDLHSYAFQEGRSARDFIYRVISMFEGAEGADITVQIDVKKYYDSIVYETVSELIELPGRVIPEFLKAGYIENDEYKESDEGIPIGSSLSPIIANMFLDGLEPLLDEVTCIVFSDTETRDMPGKRHVSFVFGKKGQSLYP